MNLDELKYIWQTHTAEQSQHSAEAIRAMLYQRSHSALRRINRNIIGESIFMGLTLLASLWLMWQGINTLPGLWPIILVLSVASLLFYRRKYQQLNRASLGMEDLRSSLGEISQVMAHYMRLYHILGMIVIPAFSIVGVFYGYLLAAQEDGRSFGDFHGVEWGILLLIAVLYGFISYGATRWYVGRLYGVHHQELQSCLQELEEAIPPHP